MVDTSIQLTSIETAAAVFGTGDKNLRFLEAQLGVTAAGRGTLLSFTGPEEAATAAVRTVEALAEMAQNGAALDEQAVLYCLGLARAGQGDAAGRLAQGVVAVTAKGKPIRAKTLGQQAYVAAIRDNPVTFGVGPAGTGKTYLAVAMAVKAFKARQVSRIILTRPAVEAGEKLGFLPGDLQNKVDPYLRPLYDGLFELLGPEAFARMAEKQQIEVAPLAYMRGRTLDDAFVILDEAQNTSREQMKMFLTRMGAGSRVVVTGDITQIDLPRHVRSGLVDALAVLEGIEGVSMVRFQERDVVRHRLVQAIVRAYEQAGQENEKNVTGPEPEQIESSLAHPELKGGSSHVQ